MDAKLRVSSSPHIRSKESVSRIMGDVIIALLPATFVGIYLFGWRAAMLIAVAVVFAMGSEAIIQKMRKRKVTLLDWSAALTGLLLALNLPSSAPWWIAAIGSVFAIAIVKQAFGGLGHNFINPALGARAFLIVSWTGRMTNFVAPGQGADLVSAATPLGILKEGGTELPGLMDVFLGNVGGTIGETSAVLIILGGLYLIYRGVITYRIPVFYIGTTFVLTFLFNGFDIANAFYGIFAGGLLFGAIFMATDYASSPITYKGQIYYAIGAGLITALIRSFGGYPEGVMFSILLMNIVTPLIERYTAPKVFGGGK